MPCICSGPRVWRIPGAGPFSTGRSKLVLVLLSPIVPHLAEELWGSAEKTRDSPGEFLARLGPPVLVEEERELVIQINGKVRSRLTVRPRRRKQEIQEQALAQPRVREWLAGKEVVKMIMVQQKLVNW